jgi:HPt (histidine-containing phosphotransfer) domain-containing protein
MLEEGPMVDDGVLAELRTSVQGDTAFVRDLVEAFVTDSAELIDAIDAALAGGDAQGLVRPAHTLKSSSATLGALSLSATARTLEAAGRSAALDEEKTRDAAARLRDEWKTATTAMRAWVDEAGDS